MINLIRFSLFLTLIVFVTTSYSYSQNNSESIFDAKHRVILKLNSTGDWVSMLNSCLERNINDLSNIQIVEESPSYIIENSSAESGSNFVANYTVGSVVTPTSLGPLFYLLKNDDDFKFDEGSIIFKLMELETEKFFFNLFGGYPSVLLNSYIVSSHIENIPEVCREIVQMVEETILPIDEQLEQIREQLENNTDGD